MPYIFGKLWHSAIIWAIRKAFQCILQDVRILLAKYTRISPTSENDSYIDKYSCTSYFLLKDGLVSVLHQHFLVIKYGIKKICKIVSSMILYIIRLPSTFPHYRDQVWIWHVLPRETLPPLLSGRNGIEIWLVCSTGYKIQIQIKVKTQIWETLPHNFRFKIEIKTNCNIGFDI